MKNYFYVLLCLCFSTTLIGQTETLPAADQQSLLEKAKWRLNIIPLNLGYEHRIGKKSTIYAQVGFDINRYQNASEEATGFFSRNIWGIAVDADIQYRYYYNIEKRKAQNRNYESNSANFIGGQITPIFSPISTFGDEEIVNENGAIISAIWGIQRVKKDLLVFNFTLGPAVRVTSEMSDFDLQMQLSLGFILGD